MRPKLAAICLVLALAPVGDAARASGCGTLYALALEHARDMARRESLDHDGFFTERGPRGAMAENVAVGCKTESCAREVWLKSPPHRANMMLGGCQAVASAVAKSGRRYWAMEIGGSETSAGVRAAGIARWPKQPRHVKGYDEFDDHGRGAELR